MMEASGTELTFTDQDVLNALLALVLSVPGPDVYAAVPAPPRGPNGHVLAITRSWPDPPATIPPTDFDWPPNHHGAISQSWPSNPHWPANHLGQTSPLWQPELLGARLVSGNLRLLDADAGVIRYGYFDAHDPAAFHQGAIGPGQGLRLRRDGVDSWSATFGGRTVRFVLPSRALERSDAVALRENERFVTGVLDESGVAFQLIYNTARHCFYYCINPSMPPADRFVSVGGDPRFLVGQETRFVVYRDLIARRDTLVGVLVDNVRRNNCFDGPFDQVPPRLPLREMLEQAYPYVTYRGGIDEHGNFNRIEGERVAISCYQAYERLAELIPF